MGCEHSQQCGTCSCPVGKRRKRGRGEPSAEKNSWRGGGAKLCAGRGAWAWGVGRGAGHGWRLPPSPISKRRAARSKNEPEGARRVLVLNVEEIRSVWLRLPLEVPQYGEKGKPRAIGCELCPLLVPLSRLNGFMPASVRTYVHGLKFFSGRENQDVDCGKRGLLLLLSLSTMSSELTFSNEWKPF